MINPAAGPEQPEAGEDRSAFARLIGFIRRIWPFVAIVISVLAVGYAVYAAQRAGGLGQVVSSPGIIPALALMLIHIVAGAGRYAVAARTRLWPAIVGFVVAEFANAVSIGGSGGMPMVVVYFARTGMGWGAGASVAAAAVLMDGAWNIATLGIASLSDPDLRPAVLAIMALIVALYLLRKRVGRFLVAIVRGPLRRWEETLLREWAQGRDALRHMGPREIAAAMALTALMWTTRYLMLNALISAYNPLHIAQHFNLIVRQVVYQGLLIISPTPGGAGTAELAFGAFFGDFLAGMPREAIWVVWRFLTYYAYLIPGGLAFATVFWPQRSPVRWLAERIRRLRVS
jgi:uncharacterized membrane protein YbhN (UPF0104 family)